MAASGKYKKSFDKKIVELMSEGYSLTASAGVLKVAGSTVTDWRTRYPSFGEAVEHGKTLRRHFYEEIGMRGMMGKIPGFNVTVWKLTMQSEFGLTERQSVDMEAKVQTEININFVDK